MIRIAYHGPGLAGKLTNLRTVHAALQPAAQPKLTATGSFDDLVSEVVFIPQGLPPLDGEPIVVTLRATPGHRWDSPARREIVQTADGIVFVADSQWSRDDANISSFEDMHDYLHEAGRNVDDVPLVIQLNKRDLPDVMPVDLMHSALDRAGRYETIEASAVGGQGVMETLKVVLREVLLSRGRR